MNFIKIINVVSIILCVFILTSLIFIEAKIILSIIFLVTLGLILYFSLTKKKIKQMSLKAREFRGYQLKDLNHLFSSIKLVKIFNREKYFSNIFYLYLFQYQK